MKTKEELNALKEEVESKSVHALSDDELEQAVGGNGNSSSNGTRYCKYCNKDTPQLFKGVGQGWDKNGYGYICNLWECTVCKNTNYWAKIMSHEELI